MSDPRPAGAHAATTGDASTPRAAPPVVAAALCIAIALANLAGWAMGVRALVSIDPALPAMVPMTAVLALLTAGGVWMQWRWPDRAGRAAVLPALAIAACLAIVACYVAGGAPPPFGLAQSGREFYATLSSPLTAAVFLALGCALLLSAAGRPAAAQGFALAVLLVTTLNVLGYLARDTVLYRILPGSGTSLPTSALAILLALAILFLQPRRGLMAAMTGELPGARIARRLLLGAFVLPVAAGVTVAGGHRLGLYDAGAALPLFAWSTVVLLLAIGWRFALQLSVVDVARAEAQAGLQQALQALRAEHDRKDIFLATLAHELRNPLAPISAAAEVLRHGGGQQAEERLRIGTVIAAQAANLVHLVNDLLDLERVSSGRIALDRQALDLREPLDAALEQVRPLIVRKGHACRKHVPELPVHVCGDRTRLVQILSNLLNNAAKYTPPGGTLDVCLQPGEHAVAVSVEDNGIGIAPDVLARVFDPYAQARLTPDRADGGLGLGLSLVKRLTELHGGSVVAYSAGEGQGSRFVVTLPCVPPSGCVPDDPAHR